MTSNKIGLKRAEQEKKTKEIRAKNRTKVIKEIHVGCNIGPHDLEVKMNTFSPDYNENKINNILLSLSKEISSFSNLKNPSINLKKRREFFIKELDDLTFDASRHNISIKTIELSKKLLQEMKTNQFLEAIWSGKVVNITENRQA